METKLCKYCYETKTIDLFYRISSKSAKCKQCHSNYVSNYLKTHPEYAAKNREYARNSTKPRKRRKKGLTWDLKRGPCMDCGNSYHPTVMDFDHRPGTDKVMAVSMMVLHKYSDVEILKEISKCDLVCANCHRIRTAKRWYGEEEYNKELRNENVYSQIWTKKTTGRIRKEHVPHFCKCGIEILQKSVACKHCSARPTKIIWPSKEELIKMTEQYSYLELGRRLGVSDNAIRKHLNKN